jgi:hypothetical protein
MESLPSINDFLIIAPLATLVMLVVAVGFWAGFMSQQKFIKMLQDLVFDRRKK